MLLKNQCNIYLVCNSFILVNYYWLHVYLFNRDPHDIYLLMSINNQIDQLIIIKKKDQLNKIYHYCGDFLECYNCCTQPLKFEQKWQIFM